ncbi:MAG TPA: serine/threonine-protein kinase [Chloroflexia bacterium]|nr:serine/threonine-protein kinase [Chloroflexia bacterium]
METINKQLDAYQLETKLAEGGRATIWRARLLTLERVVALKVISDTSEKVYEKRFKAILPTLAQLEHPNILPLIDYGHSGNDLYMVYQLAEGGNLGWQLQRNRLSREKIFDLVDQILAALAFAHMHGFYHGDVKPANILFLDQRPDRPLLADFGMARLFNLNEEVQATLTGSIIGTPEYMAPEQFMGQTEQASDLYSVAVILFELLTNETPYKGKTPWELGMRHMNDPLPLPHPQIPAALEPFFNRALHKRYEQRFNNAQEMRQSLAQAFQRLSPAELAFPYALAKEPEAANQPAVIEKTNSVIAQPTSMKLASKPASGIKAQQKGGTNQITPAAIPEDTNPEPDIYSEATKQFPIYSPVGARPTRAAAAGNTAVMPRIGSAPEKRKPGKTSGKARAKASRRSLALIFILVLLVMLVLALLILSKTHPAMLSFLPFFSQV